MIGMGSIVTRSVPDFCLAIGPHESSESSAAAVNLFIDSVTATPRLPLRPHANADRCIQLTGMRSWKGNRCLLFDNRRQSGDRALFNF